MTRSGATPTPAATPRAMSRRGWALLTGELRRQRAGLLRLAGWAAIEALPALLAGHLLARAIDQGFLAGRPLIGVAWLVSMLAVHAVSALAIRQSFPALGTVVEPVRDALLTQVVDATLHRATAGLERPDAAVVSRLTQQVEAVRDVLAGLLLNVRRFLFTVVAATIGLLTLDPAIALLALPPVVLAMALFGWLLRTLITRQRAVVMAEEAVASSAGIAIGGVRDVVAAGAESHVLTTVDRDLDASAGASRSMGRGSALRSLVTAVGAYLPLFLVLVAAPSLLRRGVTVGEVLGAITYLTASLEPAVRLATQTIGASGLRLAVTLRRLAEVCTRPDEPATSATARRAGHDLRIDGATFAYGARSEPVLRDLDLDLPAGTHLAIVGSSGIGKSTLANLIVGVLRPNAGRIWLGGAPLDQLAEIDLRHALTLIPQEAYVFAGTVRENLCYQRVGLSQHELDRAVDEIGLRPVIDRMGGYDADLDPTALSAGERQLVALVRAYVSPAEVLVLDEATCHLDPRAEARAEEAFGRRHGTLIVIAHRISSARRADRILLLDGVRAHYGTHPELLAHSVLYADLVGHWDSDIGVPTPQPVEVR